MTDTAAPGFDFQGFTAADLYGAAIRLEAAAAAERTLAAAYRGQADVFAALIDHLKPMNVFRTDQAEETASNAHKQATEAEGVARTFGECAVLCREAAKGAPGGAHVTPPPTAYEDTPEDTAAFTTEELRNIAHHLQTAADVERNRAECIRAGIFRTNNPARDEEAAWLADRIANGLTAQAQGIAPSDKGAPPRNEKLLNPGRPALRTFRFAAIYAEEAERPPQNDEELQAHLDKGGHACQWILRAESREIAARQITVLEAAVQAAAQTGRGGKEGEERR